MPNVPKSVPKCSKYPNGYANERKMMTPGLRRRRRLVGSSEEEISHPSHLSHRWTHLIAGREERIAARNIAREKHCRACHERGAMGTLALSFFILFLMWRREAIAASLSCFVSRCCILPFCLSLPYTAAGQPHPLVSRHQLSLRAEATKHGIFLWS